MKTRTVAHKVFGWGTNSGFADEAITMDSIENMSNQDVMAQCIPELPRQHEPDTAIPSTAPYPGYTAIPSQSQSIHGLTGEWPQVMGEKSLLSQALH